MQINTDNERKIEVYIRDHPDCLQKNTETVYIQDQRQDLSIYRLPLDYIFFNITNGRFAAEYKALVEEEKRELNAADEDDAKKLQDLLLIQDPKQTSILEADLRRYGQRYPGIMTWDGYLVNGNRRMAVLKKLSDQGEDRFGYLLVARLPKNTGQIDIWKIEAGIQLSRQEKLDYGPINTLLKLKQGREATLTNAQIANILYGGFTEEEIEERLKRLELIEEYLNYIKQSGNYKKAEGVHEHFIVLRSIIEKMKKDDEIDSEDILKVQKIAFELIRKGLPQMKLRYINKIMENPKAKENLLKAESILPEIRPPQELDEKISEKDDEED